MSPRSQRLQKYSAGTFMDGKKISSRNIDSPNFDSGRNGLAKNVPCIDVRTMGSLFASELATTKPKGVHSMARTATRMRILASDGAAAKLTGRAARQIPTVEANSSKLSPWANSCLNTLTQFNSHCHEQISYFKAASLLSIRRRISQPLSLIPTIINLVAVRCDRDSPFLSLIISSKPTILPNRYIFVR